MAIIKNNPYAPIKKISNFFKEDLFEHVDIVDIYAYAQSLNINTFPFDIMLYLKRHNIHIIYEEMDDISGYLEYSGGWIIGLNKYQNETRQRFTASHELAHLLFDREIIKSKGKHNDFILFRDNSSVDEIEKNANDFAANLLMPQDKFHQLVKEGTNTIEGLAQKFNVSPAAAKYRAFKLGYLKGY